MNFIVVYFVLSLIINLILFEVYLNVAKKLKITDKEKNFNNPETVTSGGLIVYLNLVLGFIFFYFFESKITITIPNNLFYTFFFLSVLVMISFADDLRPIDPKIRLMIQIIVIYLSLTSVKLVDINLPMKISMLLVVLTWVYITNIINFIDGSDGFLNLQVFFIVIEIILITYFLKINIFSQYLSYILFPVLIIFLYFSKPHAKLYFGDTGSITLGFIIGYMVLELIILKYYTVAISLIIYPLFDCSLTLMRRIHDKHLPWIKRPDYFFSKLQVIDRNNKFFIYKVFLIFNCFNLFFIYLQILISNYFFLINIILTSITIFIYNNKNKLF
jgi:UDP-N-acetylmuramyl pentapeptide phosphotransferase/UDP-N-acetylglucosamine-1-phosphate transferase